MAKSLLDLGGEDCTPENAAFAIIRGGGGGGLGFGEEGGGRNESRDL